MKYRTIGTDPNNRREVSALALGAMLMGSRTDEETSFAMLDRYVEAGGTFIDTSDNYAFWEDGSQGGQSEELLGRWRRSRGIGDEIVIATKLGARPLAPRHRCSDDPEGLSAKVIRESAERSRERLGVERLDLLYAHIEDPTVPLRETVEGFAELVAEGTVGLLGVSNHWPHGGWSGPARSRLLPVCRVTRCCSTPTATCARAPTYPATCSRTAVSATPAPTCSATAVRARPDPGRLLAAPEGSLRPRGQAPPTTTTPAPRPAAPCCTRWHARPEQPSIRSSCPGS